MHRQRTVAGRSRDAMISSASTSMARTISLVGCSSRTLPELSPAAADVGLRGDLPHQKY